MSQELETLASEIQSAVGAMRKNNDDLKTKMANMQSQLDAIDRTTKSIPHWDGPQANPLVKSLEEGGGEELGRLLKSKRGKVLMEIKGGLMQHKTVLTENYSGSVGSDTAVSAGLMTTGVLPIDRTGGITTEARRRFACGMCSPAVRQRWQSSTW